MTLAKAITKHPKLIHITIVLYLAHNDLNQLFMFTPQPYQFLCTSSNAVTATQRQLSGFNKLSWFPGIQLLQHITLSAVATFKGYGHLPELSITCEARRVQWMRSKRLKRCYAVTARLICMHCIQEVKCCLSPR